MKAVLITSSLLILVLIVLRYLLRGRISPRLQYALWLLVAVRLLVPLSLPGTALSVLNVFSPEASDTTVYVSSHGLSTSAPAPETGTLGDGREMKIYYDGNGIPHFYPAGEAPPAQADYTTVPSEQIFHLNTVLRVLWLGGAAVMAVWFLTVNLSFFSRARKGARFLEMQGCPVPVYVSAAVPSPCLLGLVRQRIYVTPACTEDPDGLRHVLAHELTHRRQGDPWWSLIRAACLCLYWFDPLVWWAAALSRRDCELACDEGAIRRLGEGERFAYGRTLVGLVAAGASPGSLLQTATTMRSGKGGLKERIALIAQKPRMLAVTALCLLTAVAMIAAITFTGAKPDRTGAVELPELGISLIIPEELTLEDYSETLGYGGYLLSPDAYLHYGDGTPSQWAAAGMVGRFPTSWLTWEGQTISKALPSWNHTSYGEPEPLSGLAAPAAILQAEHDLYTAAEAGVLEESGVDLSTVELVSAYWYVFLAQPGEDSGILLSLNAKNFTREDAVDFARSVEFLEPNSESLTAAERTAALRAALAQVPEEYADRVIAGRDPESTDNILLSFWYAPDYGGDYGGWLFWVYQWDQAAFEEHLCDADHSGISCFARDADGYYYAVHLPTDVNFSPENGDDYMAVQEGLMDWAEKTVLDTEGVEPFTEDDVQALRNQPFQFQGNHITAVYHPYYAVNGEWEPTWTFILSQPAAQGEGGIWCVEQVWFPGGEYPDRRVIRPDTDLPWADYYAQLQARADTGQADWALDPMEVCLQYAYSYEGGHLNATAESFELSDVYSSAPYSSNDRAAAGLTALLENDSGLVVFDLQAREGDSWADRQVSVPTDDPSLPALLESLTEDISWVDTRWTWPLYTDPWGDESLAYFLSIYDPLRRYNLTVYAGGVYAAFSQAGGGDTVYQVTASNGSGGPAEVIRAWLDPYSAGAASQSSDSLGQTVQETVDLIRLSGSSRLSCLNPSSRESGQAGSYPVSTDSLRYSYSTLGDFFQWTESTGLSAAREPASVTLSTADTSVSVTAYQGTGKLLIRQGDTVQWLAAEPADPDDVFAVDLYHYMRCWYDGAQWEAHSRDLAIPDTGQSWEEIAQDWAEAYEGYRLETEPGGRNTCTFVQVEARVRGLSDTYANYPEITEGRERFVFSYTGVFVPENDLARLDLWPGNTTEYQGDDAPAGALTYMRQGILYRADDGWRCAGLGTGL